MTDPFLFPYVSNGGLFSMLFAILFLAVCLALGRRLLIWLGASQDATALERDVIAVSLGAGTLQIVPILLGALGVLAPATLRIAVGAIALLTLRDLIAIPATWRESLRGVRLERWQQLWLAALTPVIAMTLLLAMTPATDPDGLGYHLTVPRRWLAAGTLAYLPSYAYSNSPMGVEMLFAIALSFAGDAAAKCVHFGLGMIGAAALYAAGRRFNGTLAGAAVATLFLAGPFAVAPVLGLAYLEGAIVCAMATATLAWAIWYQGGSRSWLAASALLAGIAVSFKMTAALFPIALFTLTALADAMRSTDSRALAARVVSSALRQWRFLVLVAVPVAPWLIRAWIVTGNPFFPLLAGVFPSRELSPDTAAVFDRHFRYWNWGTSLGPEWGIERRQLLLMAVGLVVVAVGAAVFSWLRSRMARSTTIVFVAVTLTQLAAVGLYRRFWIPFAALAAIGLAAMLPPIVVRRWTSAALVVVALLGSLFHGARLARSVRWNVGGLARAAVGLDVRDFLARQLPLLPLYESGNANIPETGRILLTYNCAGFHFDRITYCDETVQDTIDWTTWEAFTTDLRRLGVTHVMAPRFVASAEPLPPLGPNGLMSLHPEEPAMLQRLIRTHGHVIASTDEHALWALDATITASR